MTSNGFKQICNVRAVHFNSEHGLYLIRSRRKGSEHLWTTPGGDVPCDILPIENIMRIVAFETGMFPLSVEPKSFFDRYVLDSKAHATIHISAYRIELPLGSSIELEGRTPSGLDYRFASPVELLRGEVPLSETTNRIVNTHTILGDYRVLLRMERRTGLNMQS